MSGSLKLPLGTKINYLTIVSYISIFNGKRNRFKYLCSCICGGHTCQLCGIKETKNMKLFVHHIIPIHIDQSKSLDLNNLISLCQECHFSKAHSGNYSKIDYSIVEQLQNKINTNLYGEMELCRVH